MTIAGMNIRRFRKEFGMTQKRLGELSEVEESLIRKYESGVSAPDFSDMRKIAGALKVGVLDIIDASICKDQILNTEITKSGALIKKKALECINEKYYSYSLDELAYECGIDISTFLSYMEGTRHPTFCDLYDIAWIFDIEVADMMDPEELNSIFGNIDHLYLFLMSLQSIVDSQKAVERRKNARKQVNDIMHSCRELLGIMKDGEGI